MKFFRKFVGHFMTITRHRHQVIKHCYRCGIFWQGLRHDLSKYSPTEFVPGVKYYTGKKSPNEGERADIGYSRAWLHHKGRNRHHFEYWTDYNTSTRKYEGVEMPFNYLVEMFCDRVAASKIYNGESYKQTDPLEYFNKGKDVRIIHPVTSKKLEGFLEMLAEEGEEKTFAHIKSLVKDKK